MPLGPVVLLELALALRLRPMAMDFAIATQALMMRVRSRAGETTFRDCGRLSWRTKEVLREIISLWVSFLGLFPTFISQNMTGSHFLFPYVTERTFLAWLRTSLAFASIGIAVTQLFRLNTSLSNAPDDGSFHTIRQLGKPLGAAFLAISILVLFLGYQRYVQSQQWVMKGKFPASRGTIVIVSLIALALMVVSLIVVVVIQPANAD